ncbi:Hypothetical protein HVR_LOCUS668 [uncultured virus]|nr:Hypothetical protein HVR_LOCUS668 [uncultured virus]
MANQAGLKTKLHAHKNDDRAAGDTIPPLPKINSLQALMRLRPKIGSEWSVYGFVLNKDMIQPDGTLDDLYAMIFPLGSFHDEKSAEEHAVNVISMTGHPGVIAGRYGYPIKLTSKFDPNVVKDVPVDTRGRIIQLESAQYKHEREEFEKRLKMERDMMKEAEEETDPDNIEHFKRQCYLAIKNRSSYQMHSKEAETAWENYKKREMAVRDHYRRHPEHESDWLKHLKVKLTERGELNLYKAMKNAYKEIRDEMLGESDDDSSQTCNQLKLDSSQHLRSQEIKSPKEGESSKDNEEPPMTLADNVVTLADNVMTLADNTTSEPILDAMLDDRNQSVKDDSTFKDNIECECPGDVCLGLIEKMNQSSGSIDEIKESVSKEKIDIPSLEEDDCPGGVCMVQSSELSADSDEIISVHEPTKESEVVKESETIETKKADEEEDELISAEEIEKAKENVQSVETSQKIVENPGFVEEPEDDQLSPKIQKVSPPRNQSSRRKGKKKRANRH